MRMPYKLYCHALLHITFKLFDKNTVTCYLSLLAPKHIAKETSNGVAAAALLRRRGRRLHGGLLLLLWRWRGLLLGGVAPPLAPLLLIPWMLLLGRRGVGWSAVAATVRVSILRLLLLLLLGDVGLRLLLVLLLLRLLRRRLLEVLRRRWRAGGRGVAISRGRGRSAIRTRRGRAVAAAAGSRRHGGRHGLSGVAASSAAAPGQHLRLLLLLLGGRYHVVATTAGARRGRGVALGGVGSWGSLLLLWLLLLHGHRRHLRGRTVGFLCGLPAQLLDQLVPAARGKGGGGG